MNPLLSTRHSWRVRFGEIPHPPDLPCDYAVVQVDMRLGMAAIDTMIDTGARVGPLLCCMDHRMLLVPVEAGTEHRWGASHSQCSAGPARRCEVYGAGTACRTRLWVIPPEPLASATTDPAVLHERLSLTRDRMRRLSRRPQATGAREACHV